jgi:hypothetical protein
LAGDHDVSNAHGQNVAGLRAMDDDRTGAGVEVVASPVRLPERLGGRELEVTRDGSVQSVLGLDDEDFPWLHDELGICGEDVVCERVFAVESFDALWWHDPLSSF